MGSFFVREGSSGLVLSVRSEIGVHHCQINSVSHPLLIISHPTISQLMFNSCYNRRYVVCIETAPPSIDFTQLKILPPLGSQTGGQFWIVHDLKFSTLKEVILSLMSVFVSVLAAIFRPFVTPSM